MIRCLIISGLLLLGSCNKRNTPAQTSAPVPGPAGYLRVINVSTSTALQSALQNARPGDEIIMADGEYNGRFVIDAAVSGTAARPVMLRGSRNAILNGGTISTGYVLHLQASYWTLKGFTLTNGLKGLMVDGVRKSVIDSLKVFTIGEEAIHLRKFSSSNTIQRCEISQVGLKTPDYGEGIYIGSAKSNWATYTNGQPDLCDSNQVLNNHIGPGITAECIDVKECTTGGLIRGNYFDATGITGANSGDSWMDIKGNYYLIEDNTGYHPGGTIFKDGFQVHVVYPGWGSYNEFRNNECSVNASGYGFNIQLSGSNGTSTGNKVYSNNTVSGAQSGIANIPLTN